VHVAGAERQHEPRQAVLVGRDRALLQRAALIERAPARASRAQSMPRTALGPPRSESGEQTAPSLRRGKDRTAVGSPFMTLVLLDQHSAGEADRRGVVREDPDDVGPAADLAVDAFQPIRGSQLGRVRGGEGVEGQQVLLGGLEQLADLWRLRPEPLQDGGDPGARLGSGG
jgi:hypothetical protein